MPTHPSKIASFYADREGVINSSSGGASKFSISGAALVNVMNNKSLIKIVEGKTLNATSGNLKINTQSNYTPAITVNNTGSAIRIKTEGNSSAYSKAPDIILNSGKKITNSAGSVTLKNSNGSVVLNGEIYSLTSTKISTPKGGTIINNTRGLQNVGEDPLLKYTFGNKKFSDWLQETIVTKNTSWFDGYKKESATETLTFKNYEHYLNFVYNMALKYNKTNLAAQRQYLSDAAGNSSWYKGNFNDDWNRWKNLMLAKYDNVSTAPTGAIVSGGAVSVIAKTLNINGLIQSGFNNYVGEVNEQTVNKLRSKGNRNLDNDEIIGDKRFKVNNTDTETVYNSQSGIYDKVVGLYYNPKTNDILTDPLQLSGGAIYLKAQDIISTGKGKIVAAGGGADINIDNPSYTPLVVKDINTTGRPEPLVMINGVDYTKKNQYIPNTKAVYAWTGGINYKKIETKSSESKELFWGLFKIKSTEDLVKKLNTEKISINTISTSTPPKEGSNLQNGVFTDYSGSGSLFTITTARESGKKVYGETSVTKKEKNILEEIASWLLPIPSIITTYTYTWTETTPNYAGSTYRINAAQPIKIQTANKTDSTINITSGGNVNVKSDLETGTNGTINLTSKIDDIITSNGSKIIAQKVSLNAAENIDVTLGLPENKTTEFKVNGLLDDSRRIFNVKINANTPLKNIDISGNKNVNIIALDDVSGKINAKNLEITSKGNINLTTQVSDTFTAQGDKSITVTQTSGDIKIGKIASGGNVTLTAQNGAIVNSVDSAVNMTGAADKISAWQAAGLISNKDSDNSATNSAQAEKATRLEGLENLFKRWALKADGTVDQTLYNEFINNTADKTKLTEEQNNQLELYQELKTSTDYGFSKNQLLYAVQESLLNPSAGITASISDPIITGKNITLTAKSLGKELAPVTYSNLSNIKTLEKLAGVKGGDVTINENGSITVKAQSPITVAQSTAQDKLNITTQGNTFISGTTDTKFNVNTPINARNNKVVLMTGNGIDAEKGIAANEIELYAGAGSLNAKLVSGKLTANALSNINISSEADMLINNVTSGANVTFFAKGNISPSRKFLIKSPSVNLTATNNIGTKSIPIFILANNTALKAKYAYIVGDYGNLNATQDTKVIIGSNGEAAGSPESGGKNTNKNISYYSPAQPSTTPTNSTNKFVPTTSNNEVLNTTNATNSPVTNNISENNFTTRTINQLDKFSHSLNHNELLNTERIDDTIFTDNFAAKIINQLDLDNILPPVNTVSEDNLTAHKRLITLPDESLYILDEDGLLKKENADDEPVNLDNSTFSTAKNKEHYVLALALSKSASLNKKGGYVYETLAKEWLNDMGYDEAEKQQIIKLSLNLRDRQEPTW